MQTLKQLATFAAQNRILGGSLKRNSILKPLQIIFEELEHSPNPETSEEKELIRAGVKDMIFEHLRRIDNRVGRTKQLKVNEYVDLFFNGVLKEAHADKVGKLLNRDKLVKSAYLFYFREAFAEKYPAKSKTTVEEETDVDISEDQA